MPEFDDTEHPPIFNIPKDTSSPIRLPKKKSIFRPPEIDPALRLKWGLALMGEEKAKEYLEWLQMRRDADNR